jgi:dienelactone hydrolase
MTSIVLFHSSFGVRPGIHDAADRFHAAGHQVQIVDQYEGRVFDDYEEAGAFVESIGFPALMQAALDATNAQPGAFVTAGFSNGAGMAEYVAAARGGRAGGVLASIQFSGALPLEVIGLSAWPAATPVQLHYAAADPRRDDAWTEPFLAAVRESGSELETHLDYPTDGHLFTDPSLPDEFDRASADLAFERALDFLGGLAAPPR